MERTSNPVESCMSWLTRDLFGMGSIRNAGFFNRYRMLLMWMLQCVERRHHLLKTSRRALPTKRGVDVLCPWAEEQIIHNAHFVECYRADFCVEITDRRDVKAGTETWKERTSSRRLQGSYYRVIDKKCKVVYKVDLNDKTSPCSCHETHWKGIPCIHVMMVLRERKECQFVTAFCRSVYEVKNVSKTCSLPDRKEEEFFNWLKCFRLSDVSAEHLVRFTKCNNGVNKRRLPSTGEFVSLSFVCYNSQERHITANNTTPWLDRHLLHRVVRPEAAALAVHHPHAQRGALHALKHDGVRLLHAHIHEARLEAARLVLDEARLLRLLDALPRHEVQLRHQLATVADAQQCQREGVRARVERIELCLQLLVEQDRRRPPACRLEHVRIDVSPSSHACCIATEVEDANQDA